MAACIFHSLKRFSFSLNSVRLQSKCLSHASFAVAGEPKPLPAIHIGANHKHYKNRELLLKSAVDHKKTIGNLKLPENVVSYSQQNTTSSSDGGISNPNQCSNEQLAIVFENLREHLPKLFVTVMDYTIYHPQLIFENNIQGKRTVGLSAFIYKISMLRMYGHFKYAFVDFEVLKMTKHPEDSTIKIRWRINGITGFQMASQMWKYKVWKPAEMLHRKRVWIDGFSTMYVGSDGKIFKHVADRVMPDQNIEEVEKEKILSPLGAIPKMALFVGLSPDISSALIVWP